MFIFVKIRFEGKFVIKIFIKFMKYIYSYLVVEVMEDGNINNLFKSCKRI